MASDEVGLARLVAVLVAESFCPPSTFDMTVNIIDSVKKTVSMTRTPPTVSDECDGSPLLLLLHRGTDPGHL